MQFPILDRQKINIFKGTAGRMNPLGGPDCGPRAVGWTSQSRSLCTYTNVCVFSQFLLARSSYCTWCFCPKEVDQYGFLNCMRSITIPETCYIRVDDSRCSS